MKPIAIIGIDGIPNRHGGFERLAEQLSMALVRSGYQVTVYNVADHPYRGNQWNGVHVIRRWSPSRWLGAAAPFIFDLLCILHARSKHEAIIQLGYTTSAIYQWLIPKKVKLITNMDGLEWSRRKYPQIIRWYLRKAENLAAHGADLLVADHPVIAEHLLNEYGQKSTFIPYGADMPCEPDPAVLQKFGLNAGNYIVLVARLQPDNHIREIIEGHKASRSGMPLVVVGPYQHRYGRELYRKYAGAELIFTGGVYEKAILDALRHFSLAQMHGHSAGGTNPSLLEAMAAGAPICAHDNPFNRYILGDHAWYFNGSEDLAVIFDYIPNFQRRSEWAKEYRQRLTSEFTWSSVTEGYISLIADSLGQAKA